MKASRITVGRLYNLGNFEHVKYEISVDIGPEDSAASAMVGIERILKALAPESKCAVRTRDDLRRAARNIGMDRKVLAEQGEEEFRMQCGHFEGTAEEYLARREKSLDEEIEKRDRYEKRAVRARELLDDLGGALILKDAKLDWQDDWDNGDDL